MTGEGGGWRARRRAALAEHEGDAFGHDDLPDLVDLLDHEDADVRAGAVWRVAELADDDPRSVERVLDDVAAAVEDPDPWVRRGATWAVEEVADARPAVAGTAMDALTTALADDDPLVRENAVVGVASVAAEDPRIAARARDELAALARDADDPRLRRYAREALERLAERLPEDSLTGSPDVRTSTRRHEDAPSGNVAGSRERETDAGREDETGPDDEVDGSEAGTSTESRERGGRRRAPVGGSGPPDSVPDPPTASVSLATFEREERIRAGPLLAVYRGRADADGGAGTVAAELRVLRQDLRDRAEVASALEMAIEDWHRIDDHEAVTTTLDRKADPPAVVTEVADGRSFSVYATRSTFEEALYYASRLVRAVAHAHGTGVIHGGLSPRAVGFVEPIEEAWHVPKVADWGIAPVVAHLDRLPVPAPYAAPEQIAPGAFGSPDQATDVYGLGALVYALFAGRPPHGEDATDVAKRIRAAERGASLPADLPDPVPPSDVAASVPAAADDLVARALARDRMGRYETVADLERDLEDLLASHASWA